MSYVKFMDFEIVVSDIIFVGQTTFQDNCFGEFYVCRCRHVSMLGFVLMYFMLGR